MNNNNDNVLKVQYPMQFNGPPRNITNPCSAPLFASQGNGGSNNMCTTRANALLALLLSSKH